MTQVAIQTQIQAIKDVTKDALHSKETAIKFLVNAGIIKDKKTIQEPSIQKNNK